VSSLKGDSSGLTKVVRRFLPPLQSFNLCDSHYSHRKQEERKDEQNFHFPATVEDVVAELHRLSRTYVYVHDPDDLLIDDAPTVDQSGDPFLRLNFEYDVQGLDSFLVRAVPSQEQPTFHVLKIVDEDRPLTTPEQAAQAFFDESVTWKRTWTPKDTRRKAPKRRREDELSFSPETSESDHEGGDSGLESLPKKKK